MEIKIKKLHPDAVIPEYATAGAAGFDLVALEDVIIELTGEDMLQLLRRKSAPTLDELCGSINDENRHEELDFGGPVGEEVW